MKIVKDAAKYSTEEIIKMLKEYGDVGFSMGLIIGAGALVWFKSREFLLGLSLIVFGGCYIIFRWYANSKLLKEIEKRTQ